MEFIALKSQLVVNYLVYPNIFAIGISLYAIPVEDDLIPYRVLSECDIDWPAAPLIVVTVSVHLINF